MKKRLIDRIIESRLAEKNKSKRKKPHFMHGLRSKTGWEIFLNTVISKRPGNPATMSLPDIFKGYLNQRAKRLGKCRKKSALTIYLIVYRSGIRNPL
jgi:hypothetical protein